MGFFNCSSQERLTLTVMLSGLCCVISRPVWHVLRGLMELTMCTCYCDRRTFLINRLTEAVLT